MILSTLLAAIIGGHFVQEPLQCAMKPEPATATAPTMDYAGVRVGFCCADCAPAFAKDPAKAMKSATADKRVIGASLFDPVSGVRLDPKRPFKDSADFGAVRFGFANQADFDAFQADPAKFAALPAKEALFCPVMKHAVPSIAESGAYADFNGVRYYLCCPDCLGEFKADPAKFAPNAAKVVRDAKATKSPKVKP